MKLLNIFTGILLSLTVGIVNADVELSSLIQWEESQKGQAPHTLAQSSADETINNINSMEATAAGQQQFSSLVQWEESQYAQPYIAVSNIDDINKLEATAAGSAGQNEMSSLIQWEESF